MGAENVIRTGNITAANNQTTGINTGGGFTPLPQSGFNYARVIEVFKDRSIRYEMIQDNLGVSAIDSPTAVTGIAYNFNPNFTRLPEEKEIVPIIKGPSKEIGNTSRMYDEIDYYILGPISIQYTVDDNKVPKDATVSKNNSINNYKLNEIGV